jgi:hypothetical protein
MPWLPVPMKPTVICLLGAACPSTRAGMIVGKISAAPAPWKKRRRENPGRLEEV